MHIVAQSLAYHFPDHPLLFQHLSFELLPGDLIGLTGPSGSGKSTLLSLLAGWVQPTSGHLTREGIDHTAWVFQNPFGVPERSALDHVVLPLLGMGARRKDAAPQARATMGRFGIAHVADRPFKSLSGGEAQRLMLARAVSTNPALLLVDEPTAQLDQASAATVNAILGELASNNTIVVIATHDPATRAACHRTIDLSDPQYAHEGS